MRVWMIAASVLLAGCAGQDSPDPPVGGDAQDGGNQTAPPPLDNATDNQTAPEVVGNTTDDAAGNATGNATGNTTDNVTAEPVLILDETFTGLLPLDGLTGEHTFTMPPGGLRVHFTYTSEYVGLFHAVARVVDAAGTTVFDTLEDCGIELVPGAETFTCEIEAEAPVPGEWTATVSYQAGQVVEDYTLEFLAWG